MQLEELRDTDPCPPYRGLNTDTFFLLTIDVLSTTVGMCKRVLATFDLLVERLGIRVVSLDFGVGSEVMTVQGGIHIGYGRPVGRIVDNSTLQ